MSASSIDESTVAGGSSRSSCNNDVLSIVELRPSRDGKLLLLLLLQVEDMPNPLDDESIALLHDDCNDDSATGSLLLLPLPPLFEVMFDD